MRMGESFTRVNDTRVVTHVGWLFFADYWGRKSQHALILLPMLILQITAVFVGGDHAAGRTDDEEAPAPCGPGIDWSPFRVNPSVLVDGGYVGLWLSLLATAAILAALVTAARTAPEHPTSTASTLPPTAGN